MGYYPIKCIHCMRPLKMEDRCVKLAPEEIKSFDSGLDRAQEIDLNDDLDIRDRISGSRNKKILYKKLAELRAEGVIEKEEILPIKISGEFQNIEECRKDFVQSIIVRNLDVNEIGRASCRERV